MDYPTGNAATQVAVVCVRERHAWNAFVTYLVLTLGPSSAGLIHVLALILRAHM